MPHILAVGKTMCGKSRLFRRICEEHRRRGRGCIVLEQRRDEYWLKEGRPQAFIRDPKKFLAIAKANQNLNLVVEDAYVQLGKYPKDGLAWLGTDSRHNGHVAMFGVQAYTNFSTVLREMVQYVAAFKCGIGSAKAMAEEYCKDEFLECPRLPYGTYLWYNQKTDVITKRVLFK